MQPWNITGKEMLKDVPWNKPETIFNNLNLPEAIFNNLDLPEAICNGSCAMLPQAGLLAIPLQTLAAIF
jgi:hypothetical protein